MSWETTYFDGENEEKSSIIKKRKLGWDRDTNSPSVQIITIWKDTGYKRSEVFIYDKKLGWKKKEIPEGDHDTFQ